MRNFLSWFTLAAVLALPALSATSSAAEPIHVQGTTNLASMIWQAVPAYQDAHPGIAIQVQGTSSGAGIAALKSHEIDVAMSDVAISDPDFTDTTLGVVGFAFVTAPDVGVNNLTRKQLIDIFAGNITNWKGVGGRDEKIVLIGRDIGTGTRLVLEQKVAKTLIPTIIEANAKAVVSAVKATPGALGYVATAFLGEDKNLAIEYNGVEPSEANIRNHTYAFSTDEHLYTLKTASPDVQAFVNFIKSDAALLESNGVY